jgi:hypothetical protein
LTKLKVFKKELTLLLGGRGARGIRKISLYLVVQEVEHAEN